jgi:hypothetical protein
MKMFNIFKKKPQPVKEKVKNNYNYDLMTYTINGKEYAICDSQLIKIQAVADDVYLYGWSLEVRYKMSGGEFCNWFTYWNHHIYVSRSSALDAATKVCKGYNSEWEWRIIPLYKMTEPEYRDYKIDQLLTQSNKVEKKYEIKAWKVKEDCEIFYQRTNQTFNYKKGNLFIQMENGSVQLIRDQTSGINYHDKFQLFNDLLNNDKIEEVNIQNEKWAHPHLCKELKIKIKNKI